MQKGSEGLHCSNPVPSNLRLKLTLILTELPTIKRNPSAGPHTASSYTYLPPHLSFAGTDPQTPPTAHTAIANLQFNPDPIPTNNLYFYSLTFQPTYDPTTPAHALLLLQLQPRGPQQTLTAATSAQLLGFYPHPLSLATVGSSGT